MSDDFASGRIEWVDFRIEVDVDQPCQSWLHLAGSRPLYL